MHRDRNGLADSSSISLCVSNETHSLPSIGDLDKPAWLYALACLMTWPDAKTSSVESQAVAKMARVLPHKLPWP